MLIRLFILSFHIVKQNKIVSLFFICSSISELCALFFLPASSFHVKNLLGFFDNPYLTC